MECKLLDPVSEHIKLDSFKLKRTANHASKPSWKHFKGALSKTEASAVNWKWTQPASEATYPRKISIWRSWKLNEAVKQQSFAGELKDASVHRDSCPRKFRVAAIVPLAETTTNNDTPGAFGNRWPYKPSEDTRTESWGVRANGNVLWKMLGIVGNLDFTATVDKGRNQVHYFTA